MNVRGPVKAAVDDVSWEEAGDERERLATWVEVQDCDNLLEGLCVVRGRSGVRIVNPLPSVRFREGNLNLLSRGP